MKNYSDFDRVKVVKPLRTKITTVLGIPSNGISFSGQKRHASENRYEPGVKRNREQGAITTKKDMERRVEIGLKRDLCRFDFSE